MALDFQLLVLKTSALSNLCLFVFYQENFFYCLASDGLQKIFLKQEQRKAIRALVILYLLCTVLCKTQRSF